MLYFAYGSNMDINQMNKRCTNNFDLIGTGILDDYEFFINNRGVANICVDTLSSDSKVYGLVFEISKKCLKCLDKNEGYPKIYTRDLLPIKFNHQKKKVLVYFDCNNLETGSPRKNYLERIIKAADKFNFPDEYISHLNTFLN